MDIEKFFFSGATDQFGIRHVRIVCGQVDIWLPAKDVTEPTSVRKALAPHGILIAPGQFFNELHRRICEVDHFPSLHFGARPGWQGSVYLFGDGVQKAPEGVPEVPLIMKPHTTKWGCSGTLDRWRRKVARPLTGQAYPMFSMMLAFAPPLRKFVPIESNVGVEGVGDGGAGKTAVAKLVASIMGGCDENCPTRYIESWHGTVYGINRLVDDHTDALLILDEFNAFSGGATQADKRKAYQELIFQLGGGLDKAKGETVRPSHRRFFYYSTSNQSLLDELGVQNAKSNAAADRLITIPADQGKGLGVFAFLPPEFESYAEFIVHLLAQARANHGWPFRVFIERLVTEAGEDMDGLKAKLDAWVEEFRRRAGPTKDGSLNRVLAFFALVYAAGKLAQSYHVLPRTWRCGSAVKAIYDHYCIERARGEGSARQRFHAYASSSGVIDLRTASRAVTLEEFLAAPGMWVTKSGDEEFWANPEQLKSRLLDSRGLLQELDQANLLVREGAGLSTKRRHMGVEFGRVYCIRKKGSVIDKK